MNYQINFNDDQLEVYSVKIAELLIRCSIEIETLSKKLYWDNGGEEVLNNNRNNRHLYFDSDCINHLENLWKLSRKKVFVSAPTFYFENEENNILTPLKKTNRKN